MMQIEPPKAAENRQNGATNVDAFAAAVRDFEAALPGFWWSVGMCQVGADASCAVDGGGPWASLLDGIEQGDPLDSGFHCDTSKGLPHEALRDVLQQALRDHRVRAVSERAQEDRP